MYIVAIMQFSNKVYQTEIEIVRCPYSKCGYNGKYITSHNIQLSWRKLRKKLETSS